MSKKDTLKEEVVTINIDKILLPASIFFSALVLFAGLIIGSNTIAGSMKNIQISGGGTTGTTDTGGGTAAAVSIDQIKGLFNGDYISFGNPDAKVLFVQFSDPSCPYCHVAGGYNPEINAEFGGQFVLAENGGTYVPPVKEMKKMLDSGEAAFAWLFLNGHGYGEVATKAMYCANDQGKFWEAHDTIMTKAGYDLMHDEKESYKDNEAMSEFLKGVVNKSDLKKCLDDGKYDDILARDLSVASSFQAQGTPFFFVNTTSFAGAYSFTDMQSVITAALE